MYRYKKSKSTTNLWVIPVAIAALVSSFGLGYFVGRRQDSLVAKKDFCVGVILPLTGDSAYIGQFIKNGMEVANAEFSKEKAPKDFSLRLEFADNGGDQTRVVTAYQSLVNVKNCQSLIAVQQGVKALIPLAERDKRVLLATSVPDNGIAGQNPWTFRFFLSADQDTKTMANYAFNKLNARKAAILYVNNSAGISYRDSFSQNFTALGGEILEEQTFNNGDVDYRTQILKIKKAEPDVIYIMAYGKSMANIPIQIREAKVNATLLSVGTISQPEILQAAGEAANDIYYTTAEFAVKPNNAGTAESQQFEQNYKAKFGKEPVFFEFFGHDSLKLLLLAAQRGDVEPEKLRQALSDIQDIPLAVGTISVDKDGNVQFPVIVRKIIDGKWAPAP